MGQVIKQQVIRPQYYDKFSCIMSACEDDCCSRVWDVPIGKSTFDKYKDAANPRLRQKLYDNVERVEGAKDDDFSYARIKIEKGGQCPFHTEDGLCEIHRDLGEEFLGSTCRAFPRCHRMMTGEYSELSASMACPEAVRVALFDDSPMEFVIDMMEFDKGNPLYMHMTKPSEGKGMRYLEHGWGMREAAITIMQVRDIPVAYRIIIIAMMLYDAVELHDAGRANEIPGVLQTYCNGSYGEAFAKELGDTPANEELQIRMCTLLYYAIKGEAAHPQRTVFAQLLERFGSTGEEAGGHLGADTAEKAGAEEFYAFIRNASDTRWAGFTEKWEHVLENYMVSFMFSELFPVRYLDAGLDPYHHCFLLAEQYATLKMLLCGNYDPDDGFSKQYIVRTFAQVATISQHTRKPLKIADSYRKAGISSPAHLYYMLN